MTANSPAGATAHELAGKACLITGSTSGIGLGIAQAFARAGMNVMLNGLGDAVAIDPHFKAAASVGKTAGVPA